VSETASTDAASESNQGEAGASNLGVGADGGGAGTEAAAESDAFAAERMKLTSTIRELQSAKDREAAARAAAERKLTDSSTPANESQATPGLTYADLRRVREMDRMADSLKNEFPDADPALFGADPLDFETPEAYRLSVSRSHEARVAQKAEFEAAAEAKVRAAYAEKYGPLGDEKPEATGDPVGGMPTAARLAAMSLSEQIAFEAENPGVIDKVLSNTNPSGLMLGGN
jgi:hypothetical protein